MSPWVIASQNGLGWSSVLIVGQFPQTPLCSAWHIVRFGDTLSGIAWWYGVNLYTLAARNNIYNVNLIFVGTTLCIP